MPKHVVFICGNCVVLQSAFFGKYID